MSENQRPVKTCDALGNGGTKHLTASLHSCLMHMLPPISLGLGHTMVEAFPSLRLQRWTSSAVPLLRSELPSSLKSPALGVSLLAAISIPKLLPQKACGY